MRMRFELKQISNLFPVENLGCNYLSFVIADKIDYRLHMMKIGSNKSKSNKSKLEYDKKLRDLTNEIYVYRNQKQQRDTYLYQITTEPNSKDSILKLLESIIMVLSNLSDNISFKAVFKVQKKELKLDDYIVNIEYAKKHDIDYQIDKLYNDIISVCSVLCEQAQVRQLIANGNISLIIRF